MNDVGFNVDFGNGYATIIHLDRDNIATTFADWPRGFCNFGECLNRWMFQSLVKVLLTLIAYC